MTNDEREAYKDAISQAWDAYVGIIEPAAKVYDDAIAEAKLKYNWGENDN